MALMSGLFCGAYSSVERLVRLFKSGERYVANTACLNSLLDLESYCQNQLSVLG